MYKTRLSIIPSVLFFLFSISTFGQIQVTGKVVDNETKKPISNAQVKVADTELETKTNFGGYFQLILDTTHHVLISSPGYTDIEIKVTSSKFQVSMIKLSTQTATLTEDENKMLYSYLNNNIRYPLQARKVKLQGILYASFDIDAQGKTQNIKIIKDIGYKTGEEVLSLLHNMPQLPASGSNRSLVLPVVFKFTGQQFTEHVGQDVEMPAGFLLQEVVLVAY
jgi:hypothetical protein